MVASQFMPRTAPGLRTRQQDTACPLLKYGACEVPPYARGGARRLPLCVLTLTDPLVFLKKLDMLYKLLYYLFCYVQRVSKGR